MFSRVYFTWLASSHRMAARSNSVRDGTGGKVKGRTITNGRVVVSLCREEIA
jgi:hypothetical protein